MKAITVSLIEDDPATVDVLAGIIESARGFRVASRHADAEDALSRLPAIQPALALVDIQLPGLNGIECIRRLKRLLPDVLCLVITQFDDGDLLFAALQAGADGYLLKRAPAAEIIEAIRTVKAGGGAMSPSICRKVLDHFQKLAPSADAQLTLSDREITLLQLARRGKRAKEIARALQLSYETVRTHFRNIYRKLHVHSLRAAVEKTFREEPGMGKDAH
jgi:DNA-binding NarL/FixJ family response regulator